MEELGLGSRRTLRTVRDEIEAYDNEQSGQPGNTLDISTVAKIIVDQAEPPKLDKYGLLEGLSNPVPSTNFDVDWVYLGKYRTAANRGGGFVYSYLLKNAVPLVPGGGSVNFNGIGEDESQEILYLDDKEAMTALSEGRFQEIKWAATFSLSMLHLKDGMPACCGKTENQL